MDVIEELKCLGKLTHKKKLGGSGGLGRGRVGVGGGQGGCERRIEVFVKIQKKNGGGGGGLGGIRVDVKEELKFLAKFTKINSRGSGGGVGLVGGSGWM